jgi:hypothetical protein
MRILRTLFGLFLLVSTHSAVAVQAKGDSEIVARKARCLLQVDGKAYISGACTFDMVLRDSEHISNPGDFTIHGPGKMAYHAYVDMNPHNPNLGEGGWNEEAGAGHMQSLLGTLKRQGACWINKRARICLWRT